jgi:hypothetical protein
MRSIMLDLRYALRQLRNAPGFAFAAVSVLALGLGANIAVFALLSGILLRPLPYAHPDRIVKIELAGPMPYYSLSYANMLQLRDAVGPQMKIGAEFFEGAGPASVIGPAGRFQISHSIVTAGMFDMLGVQPAMGRGFRDEEGQAGRNRVLLIGDDVWRKVFNTDPNIVGKTISIRRDSYTIIGVLPAGFFFSYHDKMAVWSPAAVVPGARSEMEGKHSMFGELFARLPEGMAESQLAANLSRTQAVVVKEVYFCLAQTEPGTPLYGVATAFIQVAIRAAVPADTLRAQFDKALHDVAPDATTTNVETIREAVEDSFGSQTLIAYLLEAFAALALLIASVGLYGLLSFAVAQRTREIGVRIALGAPQSGIIGMVLRRALAIVAIGLACGAVMAWFAARLADSYVFGVKPHDALTFTTVALMLAASSLLATWLPARRAAAVDPIQALRSE